jgi:two-component system response regulator
MAQESVLSEILLAEDDAGDAGLVREALKEHDVACVLHVVKDGAQAISFILNLEKDRNEPRLDLLLLDMHLPRHDGGDILRALRSTEHYARKPVIVMSSLATPADRQIAETQGAVHYFQKPSNLAEFMLLGGVVKQVLVGRIPGSHYEPHRQPEAAP